MTDSVRPGVLEQIRFLHELGVDALRLPGIPGPVVTAKAGAAGPLEAVRRDLGPCTRCALSEGRKNIVFGVGHPSARLMFIGEGPGEEEDRQGEPFVGRAGKLLDRMIAAIGLSREQVYIANIVKCRPPGNRNPHDDEIATCFGFLVAQIEAIQPRALVALGKVAASVLLQEPIAITRARGQMREFRGIPLMLTFHPAYLLRQYTRQNRQAVYDDLRQVKALVDQAGSG